MQNLMYQMKYWTMQASLNESRILIKSMCARVGPNLALFLRSSLLALFVEAGLFVAGPLFCWTSISAFRSASCPIPQTRSRRAYAVAPWAPNTKPCPTRPWTCSQSSSTQARKRSPTTNSSTAYTSGPTACPALTQAGHAATSSKRACTVSTRRLPSSPI